MCMYFNYFPLFIDKSSGKKRIMFTLYYNYANRKSKFDLMDFEFQIRQALKGQSTINYFNKKLYNQGYEFLKFVNVPCGKCPECLANRAKEWVTRLVSESTLYEHNYFVTLTYDDEHLPDDRNLIPDEISKFNKKLKMYLKRKGLKFDFRFYGVGEYGSQTARPHYHVIYFNLDIPDLKLYSSTPNGDYLFTSEFLSSVWSKGYVVIGDVTPESCAYVARYVDKKRILTKEEKKELQKKGIVPEFSIMSRNPGIGFKVFDEKLEHQERSDFGNIYLPNGIIGHMSKSYLDKCKKNSLLSVDTLDTLEYNNIVRKGVKLTNALGELETVGKDSLESYVQDKVVQAINEKRKKKRGNL